MSADDPLPSSPSAVARTDRSLSESASSTTSSIHLAGLDKDKQGIKNNTTRDNENDDDDDDSHDSHDSQQPSHPARPSLSARAPSGSLIIATSAASKAEDDAGAGAGAPETYPADDARAMSPRRSHDEIERMGNGARSALRAQAAALQAALLAVVERGERVKGEWERLEGGNRFLQSYIGELMATSKITAVRGRGR